MKELGAQWSASDPQVLFKFLHEFIFERFIFQTKQYYQKLVDADKGEHHNKSQANKNEKNHNKENSKKDKQNQSMEVNSSQ